MIEIVERWTDEESGIDCCTYRDGEEKSLKYAIIVDARQDGHCYRILKYDIPISLRLAKEDMIPFASHISLPLAIRRGIKRGRFVKLKD